MLAKASQKGLTLIEVLIASVLLFIAISLASVSYSISLKSQSSAARNIHDSMATQFIRAEISETLRTSPKLREGSGLWGNISYEWNVVDSYEKWSNAGYDQDARTTINFGRLLVLHRINVQLSNRSFVFYELYWI